MCISANEEPSQPIRVLLVEDDPGVASLAERFLEREPDLSVTTETDPRRGLNRFDPDLFDCVVSDYRMPEMDGLTFCRRIRTDEDIPCILFASVDDVDAVAAARGSSLGFVEKDGDPETYERLAAEIRMRTVTTTA